MDNIAFVDRNEFFEQIPGLIMIDMEGTVFYVNRQCADYFEKPKRDILGKYIMDVFPDSQMMENLYIDEMKQVFYSSDLGMGISIHVPLMLNGERVGLMEYDATQASEVLYELSDGYSRFLDNELKQLNRQTLKKENSKYTIKNLVGNSQAMVRLKEQIISASRTSSTVLITGETGTGKELTAHAIHNLSGRRKERFVEINASSFPESLIESELFGYESGSFTGARKEGKKGRFEMANKGTLFIDEINQMPLSIQPKLLKVLQEKEVDRIGGEKPIPIDVRIIAATNENLEDLVAKDLFRKDLYYRLNVINLKIPPLRERKEDMEDLVKSIIGELNDELGLAVNGIDDEALKILKRHSWDGNVRELRNAIERAMNFASGDILNSEDFGFGQDGDDELSSELPEKGENLLRETRNRAESRVIREVLEHFGGNKSKAAEYLGMARPALYQRMKRLGMM